MTRIRSNPPPGLSTSPQKQHTIGETKNVNGTTLTLNRNFRWERADDDENDTSQDAPPVQPDTSHEDRHAIVAANLKTVPKPLAGVIRSLHESPEYKAGNAVTSMDLHPDVHGKLYANLKQNVGTEMSGGRVVDFGGGRIGFASRAGSLVLWQNGRVAYTNQTGIIDQEAIQGKNLASVDSEEGDIIPTADESELDTPATRAAGATAEEAAMAKAGVNKLPTKTAKELRQQEIEQLDAKNKKQAPELLDKPLRPGPAPATKPPVDHAKRASEIASQHEGDGWELLKKHAKEFAENPELVDHVRQAFEAKESASQPGGAEPEAAEGALQNAVDTSPPVEATPKAVEPQQAEQALSDRLGGMNEAQQVKSEQGLGLTPDFEARAAEQIRKMRERRAAKERGQAAPVTPPSATVERPEPSKAATDQDDGREPPSYSKAPWNNKKWREHVRTSAIGWEMEPEEYESIANDVYSKYAEHSKAKDAAREYAMKATGLDEKDIDWLEQNGYDYAADPKKIKGKVPRRKHFHERFPGGGFGLDDTGRSIASQFPELGWGGGYGAENEGEDLDAKLWDLLRQGKQKPLTRLSPEFHAEVDAHIQDLVDRQSSGGGTRPGTEPSDEDWKNTPFQKRGIKSQYAWDESKHPRGQPDNAGQFIASQDEYIKAIGGAATPVSESSVGFNEKKTAPRWACDDNPVDVIGDYEIRKSGNDYHAFPRDGDDDTESVGYILVENGQTDLAVDPKHSGKGIGLALSLALRREKPFHPSGGLSSGGQAILRKVYDVLMSEGIIRQRDRID